MNVDKVARSSKSRKYSGSLSLDFKKIEKIEVQAKKRFA